MKIRPLHDRLLVRRAEEETTTAGGIVIPDSAAEKPIMGTVEAAGPGKATENGGVHAMCVKVGDTVLFGKYAGTEVKVNGETLLMMREEDVLGVVEG